MTSEGEPCVDAVSDTAERQRPARCPARQRHWSSWHTRSLSQLLIWCGTHVAGCVYCSRAACRAASGRAHARLLTCCVLCDEAPPRESAYYVNFIGYLSQALCVQLATYAGPSGWYPENDPCDPRTHVASVMGFE